jgi:hypothetical protein
MHDYEVEEGILSLKQETLDADLDQFEKEVALKYPKKRTELARIFDILKKQLLKFSLSYSKNLNRKYAPCVDVIE